MSAATFDVGELNLSQLRTHRAQLRHEADQVSYWRRLVHARIDLISLAGGEPGQLRLSELVEVLTDSVSGNANTGHQQVWAFDPPADVPSLDVVWRVPGTLEQAFTALVELEALDTHLSGRRAALYGALGEATHELVSRYQSDPSLVLSGR